jgi:hypothetical protein
LDNVLTFSTVSNFLLAAHLCERLVDNGGCVVAFDRFNSIGSEALEKAVNLFLEKKRVKDKGSTKYYA